MNDVGWTLLSSACNRYVKCTSRWSNTSHHMAWFFFNLIKTQDRFFSTADSLEIKLNLTGLLADQSSTADHTSFGFGIGYASRAIDGNYNTDFAARSCSHTSETAIGISWWRIDLGQPFKVQRIVIVNRGDCCGKRQQYTFDASYVFCTHLAFNREHYFSRRAFKFRRQSLGFLDSLMLSIIVIFN